MSNARNLMVWFCLFWSLAPTGALGCYAVIVGRAASADGSVLVGHNEQNSGRRILNFRRIPEQDHPPGSMVKLLRGGVLPQVSQTAAFFWSENPGLEFSDAYCNEHGVAVVSDSCPTREDGYETLARRNEIRHGGIGYMLRRLVIERAKTAREGVELAGELIERFGYVHTGRTYVIADPNEAWLLAVVRGRRWVAMRVPDDKVVILPNIPILGEIDLSDKDNYLASADLLDYAVQRGWYDPADGEPFNFRRVYRPDRNDRPDRRRWRGHQLVTGIETAWPPKSPPPVGVTPKEPMTVAAVAAILRDTAGPSRALSSPVTQEGSVFQLRRDMPIEIGCVWWRITAEPSCGVLLPCYLGVTETPGSFYRPVDVKTQLSLKHHFEPPEGTFDPDPKSAWWTFKQLQDAVREDFDERIDPIRSQWADFESRLFGQQPNVEKKALGLWRTDRRAAQVYLTKYCHDAAAEAIGEVDRILRNMEHLTPPTRDVKL